MPWVRLEDNFYEHPKFAGRSLAAVGLWAIGLGYCNKWLTDGHIPAKTVRLLGGTKKTTDELVAAGLWEPVDGGWQYHDYLDIQPSAAAIRARREERAASGKRGASSRWGPRGSPDGSSHGNSHSSPMASQMPQVPSPKSQVVTPPSKSSSEGSARADDDDGRVLEPRPTEALLLVGQRRHETAKQAGRVNGNADRHLAACLQNALTELGPQAHRLADEHPNADPAALADLIDPPAAPRNGRLSIAEKLGITQEPQP